MCTCKPKHGCVYNISDLQSVIDSMSSIGGGVCKLQLHQDAELNATIHVHPGVTVKYSGLNKLIVNDSLDVAFNLAANASLEGINIHKKGVSFSQGTLAGFQGTAVQIVGHDARVADCSITGFAQAILSSGFGRCNIYRNKIDCLNGIWLHDSYDVSRIEDNHCWPFVTMAWAGVHDQNPPISANRPGVGYKLSGVNDWTQLRGNFSYAYAIGYEVYDASDVTLVQCGADGSQGTSNNTSYYVHGASRKVTFVSCQAAGNFVGYWIDAPHCKVHGKCNSAWGIAQQEYRVVSGNAPTAAEFLET